MPLRAVPATLAGTAFPFPPIRARVTPLPITLFADFASPGCYLTEAALRRRAERGDVTVRYRAVELHPAPAPLPEAPPPLEDALVRVAADEGLAIRDPGFVPRTRKAHEAARFAAERGVEGAMRDAIYRALWTDGLDIGRIDVLRDLVAPLGVDPEELKIALDIDRWRDEVEEDGRLAARLRIPAVPVLYLGTGPSARILLGAQRLADLDEAIATR